MSRQIFNGGVNKYLSVCPKGKEGGESTDGNRGEK